MIFIVQSRQMHSRRHHGPISAENPHGEFPADISISLSIGEGTIFPAVEKWTPMR
jgi:hypothetical protein